MNDVYIPERYVKTLEISTAYMRGYHDRRGVSHRARRFNPYRGAAHQKERRAWDHGWLEADYQLALDGMFLAMEKTK